MRSVLFVKAAAATFQSYACRWSSGALLTAAIAEHKYRGPTIVCASPQRELYRLQRKGGECIVLFLPLCSLDELLEMQRKLHPVKVGNPANDFCHVWERHNRA